MTAREAIKILMESPFYFNMENSNRLVLVREYCLNYSNAATRRPKHLAQHIESGTVCPPVVRATDPWEGD